ncbi:hypothetical protein QBC44DRAFT_48576 [Cladorrhinum sp. PSN332]|nr:hypothetical protein QBC44DRAFT_48576 [Cladorrhinum sp. PSN332]
MVQLTSVTLFFLECLAGVAWAQTAATDAPARYQGLYRKPEGGGVETLNCGPNSIFATSSSYAGCCSIGGNCNFPTACATGTATNRLGGTFTCGQDQQCYTMTVIGNLASPTQSVVVHNCAKEWLATTIYREIPAAATTSSPVSSASNTASTGASITSSSIPEQLSTSTPPPNPKSSAIPSEADALESEPSKKPNAGLIAGIVIAVFFALVVVGLLGFWFGRKDGLRSRPSPSPEEGSNPFQLLGASGLGSASTSHIRSATGLTGVSGIGSIPGVPNDPWYGYTFPAPPKSPGSGGYPESPYDKFVGQQHFQVNEMEGDSVSVKTAGEKSLTGKAGGGHFFEHGLGVGPGPTVPGGVYRDSSKSRKSLRAGHAELEGDGLGMVPVRKKSMI